MIYILESQEFNDKLKRVDQSCVALFGRLNEDVDFDEMKKKFDKIIEEWWYCK